MYPEDHFSRWRHGQGHWGDVAPEQWNDWLWQMRHRIVDGQGLEKLMQLTENERQGLMLADEKLAFSLTPHFFNLIDRGDPDCPIRKQVIPRAAEMVVNPEELEDPVGEEKTSPVPRLVHRYPDRVLLLATDRCASYCRYCTRSRLVSGSTGYAFATHFEPALQYIEAHNEVRDVLISGGDPLILSDDKIDHLLKRLRAIEHVEFIRIGTRAPVFMPQRVTDSLCAMLEKYAPIFISLHTNHPRECTQELKQACQKLIRAGCVLGNQSVLLKGVNDTAAIQRSLAHRLLQMGVRPYYLYQCDLITGSAHFRTNVQTGIEIIRELRGFTSGYAIPQYVIDAPGGGGKVPANPQYIQSIDNKTVRMLNWQGDSYEYPQPQ